MTQSKKFNDSKDQFEFRTKEDDGATGYGYELNNVFIKSYSTSGDADDAGAPMDVSARDSELDWKETTTGYTEVEWTY